MISTALAALCLSAAPEWAAFPPSDFKQWKEVRQLHDPPAAARACLPNGQYAPAVYPAWAPKTYFVAGRSPEKPLPPGSAEASRVSATVAMLRADGTCARIFTCDVPGDGDSADMTAVRVNKRKVYLFMCEGEADNYRFYQMRLGDAGPEVRLGEPRGDLDVVNPYTGEGRKWE